MPFLKICIPALLLCLAYGRLLLAQDFEVSPVRLEFAVEPGQMESKSIMVFNHGNKPQDFSLSVSDFVKDVLGRTKPLPPGESQRSCSDWLTLNPSFFHLNPNESQKVEVILTVPATGYSSRWAIIHVKAVREQQALDVDKVLATGIIVSPRISVMVYQSPVSNNKYKAIISDLKEITKAEDSLRTFSVKADNIGDKKIEVKLYLVVSNLETADEQKFDPVKLTLFPDETREVNLFLPDDMEPGDYSLAAILDYGHRTPLEALQIQIKIE